MKFLHLVGANLFRRKIRTALTVGSFAVALFLFCLLITIRGSFNQGVEAAGADRMLVINKVSLIQPLPLAYRDRILKVPGIKEATFANWFGGVYKDERNFFAQFAIDHTTYHQMFPEFVVPADQWQAFQADKGHVHEGRDGHDHVDAHARTLSGCAAAGQAADTVREIHRAVLGATNGQLSDDATAVCLSVA